MIRVVIMNGTYYGFDMSGEDSEDMIDQVKGFTRDGTAVILCECLEDAADLLNIDEDEIEMVYPD